MAARGGLPLWGEAGHTVGSLRDNTSSLTHWFSDGMESPGVWGGEWLRAGGPWGEGLGGGGDELDTVPPMRRRYSERNESHGQLAQARASLYRRGQPGGAPLARLQGASPALPDTEGRERGYDTEGRERGSKGRNGEERGYGGRNGGEGGPHPVVASTTAVHHQ